MLERESDLHLQASVVGIFRKTHESTTASATGSSATAPSTDARSKATTYGHLVRLSEERRSYVADDRTGVGVVQEIPDGQRDGHVIAVIRSRRASSKATASTRPSGTATARTAWASPTCASALRSETKRLGHPQVQIHLTGAPPVVAR